MTTLTTIMKDAEAAVYAIEAAVCLCENLAAGNFLGACIDCVTLIGWTKNALNV